MATISDITNASSYRGDPNLGGGRAVGITIDPSPLSRLATFTYYRDKDLWEKKQRDDVKAAEQIANIAAYDINSPFKPYSEDLQTRANAIKTFIKENPNALSYSKDRDGYIKLNEMMGDFEIKRKRATTNDTLYNAAKAKIELIPNKQDRDDQLKLLEIRANRLFTGGVEQAYNQQFEAAPELKSEDYVIPTIPLTEYFSIKRNPNDTEINGVSFIDPDKLKSSAQAAYFGLKTPIDINSASFKALSPQEQERTLIEDRITTRSRTNLDGIANSVNSMVSQFKTQLNDPALKVTDIPEHLLAQNSTIGGVISLSKSYNETMDKINAATGRNYPHINLDDGVTGDELITLQTFSKNKDSFLTEIKPVVQQTDNAIQKAQLAIGWYNAKTGRIQEDRLAKAAGVSDQIAASAKAYSEALLTKLKGLTDATGLISKQNISKLTADELKYMGIGSVVEGKFSLTPLDATQINNIVIDSDGNIKAYTGGDKQSLGTPLGASINISTIATNKLGEEMTLTTGKEGYNYNNLIPLYQPGGQTITTPPATTPVIQNLKPQSGYSEVKVIRGVKWGKKKDGTIEQIK